MKIAWVTCRASFFSDNITFSMAEVPNAGFKALFNEAGKAIALELKQNGMTINLPRIELP